MEPRAAADVLRSSLKTPETPLTLADAATQSGLPLRDAERGLHHLTSEYRGHLRVTDDGDLLFLFPTGFTKPWETRDALARFFEKAGATLMGVARFVVRAWLTIAIIGYALIFLAIVIGLMFAQQNNSSRGRGGGNFGALGYVFLRLVGDALFWTFHPFSPLNYGYYDSRAASFNGARPPARKKDETPFYEKVNRFVFGPTLPKEDPLEVERLILAEIRAQKGRIGVADVMRVTGLPRDEADPRMARLMLDYAGEVEVSDDGGITYTFAELRKSAEERPGTRPPPIWTRPKQLPPLTGNGGGANFLVAALNSFNLLMSTVAFSANLTLARINQLFFTPHPRGMPIIPIPYDGIPIALGLVPLVFSLLIFALPIGRAIARPLRARAVARENGRRQVLREVVTRVEKREEVPEQALTAAWTRGAGSPPDPKELTRLVTSLGGDVDLEANEKDGQPGVRYRFADLETEAAALEEEREAAPDAEARLAPVIFRSDN
jgi:hypothetical protein